MPLKNILCLVVDRLHAGLVGAYGNSWIHTTAIDRLASESFLFDQAYAAATDLRRLYRALWLGLPPEDDRPAEDFPATFIQLLRDAGYHTALVTDEAEVAGYLMAADFAEQILIEPGEAVSASDRAETQLARLFATVGHWLETAPEPFYLMVHVGSLGTLWDAPLELRDVFADEEDPEPPRLVEPPSYWLAEDHDPDEVLGIRHAYSGQVSLLDDCLHALSESLAENPRGARTQFTLLSARGFPLGEHLRVGPCDEPLFNEVTQLIWLLRFPDARGKLARTQALVTPADLPGTLLDWLELDRGKLGAGYASSLLPVVDGQCEQLRDHLCLVSNHDRAIRTAAWLLRVTEPNLVELYAKPGDRWEVNEVGKLLPDIVVGLEAALAAPTSSDARTPLAPLAEPLVREFD